MGFLPVLAIGAAGAIMQGQTAANAANYQAQVAANNAIIARQNANYAVEAGNTEAVDAGLQARAIGGRVKATQAANNVDVNTGSAVNVQQSARQKGELDVQNTLQNAQLQAYGYRTQATNFQAQSGLYGFESGADATGGYLNAAGSLLGGAANFPSNLFG